MLQHRGAPITVEPARVLSLRLLTLRSCLPLKLGAVGAMIILAVDCDTPTLPTGPNSECCVGFAGQVLNYTTGVGLSNATVVLYTGDPHAAPSTTTTDAAGSFILTV